MKPVKMNSNPTSENWQGPNEVPVEGAHRATGAGTSLGDKDTLVFPDPEVQEKTERLKNKTDLPDLNIYEILSAFINKIGYKDSDPDELIILDFISGMTDNYVINSLDQIFVPKGII